MANSPPPYRLRPSARDDLERIWLYTRQRWSLQQADDYVRLITAAFDGIAAGTKRGRPADIREGYLKYAVGSHVVYYVEGPHWIEVARVLHGRMDVDRWI